MMFPPEQAPKAVILAGGRGSRLSEETDLKPKPLVEIGEKPILWHIMKLFSHYGCRDFIICAGYKGYLIKDYFKNYYIHNADVTFDLENDVLEVHNTKSEPWRVTILDTGMDTLTAGRLRYAHPYLTEKAFFLTYGDGVSDVDIAALLKHHRDSRCIATVTAVRPPGRFGALDVRENLVTRFREKPAGDGAWINGGFFVMDPRVLDYIESDSTSLEQDTLERLSVAGQLSAFYHTGFWQAMDTVRDRRELEALWASAQAPWKVW
jgi:glucose-1-phosphate cytidylyltransferase